MRDMRRVPEIDFALWLCPILAGVAAWLHGDNALSPVLPLVAVLFLIFLWIER
ncbi:MAG: hypothetical protein ACKO1J_03835 [Tagaea sp.]|jgi:hypothetical protein